MFYVLSYPIFALLSFTLQLWHRYSPLHANLPSPRRDPISTTLSRNRSRPSDVTHFIPGSMPFTPLTRPSVNLIQPTPSRTTRKSKRSAEDQVVVQESAEGLNISFVTSIPAPIADTNQVEPQPLESIPLQQRTNLDPKSLAESEEELTKLPHKKNSKSAAKNASLSNKPQSSTSIKVNGLAVTSQRGRTIPSNGANSRRKAATLSDMSKLATGQKHVIPDSQKVATTETATEEVVLPIQKVLSKQETVPRSRVRRELATDKEMSGNKRPLPHGKDDIELAAKHLKTNNGAHRLPRPSRTSKTAPNDDNVTVKNDTKRSARLPKPVRNS